METVRSSETSVKSTDLRHIIMLLQKQSEQPHTVQKDNPTHQQKHTPDTCTTTHDNLLTHSRSWAFLRSCQMCSYSRTSQYFMKPEGSLPCSEEPSTGAYSEPDRSSLYHPTLSLRSILILSTDIRLGLPSGLFPSGFPPISYKHSSSPHLCYMPCLSHPP
jgi:hypothetical protein